MYDENKIEINSDGDMEISEPIAEKSEFEAELENYLPTLENTDKIKKPTPGWVFSVLSSALICIVMMIIYTYTILPHMRPHAVISYSKNDTATQGTEVLNNSISAINEAVSKSIVTVESTSSFRNFFGVSTSKNSGSGIILTEDGYILTAYSLIGTEGETTVILPDKKEYSASIVGEDENNDIAVIKIDASGLPAATLGNSDNAKAGDSAIVIGNTLGSNLGTSVTRGIICGVNRGVTLKNGSTINLFQTDAITGIGSAGGCLLNSTGDVIGMITAAIASNNENISFAIPSNDIKNTVEALINTGKAPQPLMIGITGSDTEHGVTVESVIADTPAASAGIKVGDLILKVDGTTVKSISEINKIRDSHKKGDTLIISIYREGEMLDINVTL